MVDVAGDFFGAGEVLPCVACVAGLGATLDVSCALEVADTDRTDISSANVRRGCLLGMNTDTD